MQVLLTTDEPFKLAASIEHLYWEKEANHKCNDYIKVELKIFYLFQICFNYD